MYSVFFLSKYKLKAENDNSIINKKLIRTIESGVKKLLITSYWDNIITKKKKKKK